MLSEERARRCLTEEWDRPAARLTRLDGGMGSRTWIVDDAGRRWVLKAVAPHLGDQLAGGLAVASRLDRPGIPSGKPEPTTDGSLTATADGYTLGLLAWVPGDPLTGGDEHERRLIGATLARVHQALSGLVVQAARRFHCRCGRGCAPRSRPRWRTWNAAGRERGRPGCCTLIPPPRRSGSTR